MKIRIQNLFLTLALIVGPGLMLAVFTATAASNGVVVAWGNNGAGQTNVPAGLSNVMAIAAGFSYVVALKNNGTVVSWGDNTYGETNIPAGLSNVTAIAAGNGHTVALKSDGTVVAWGNNDWGQTNVPAGLSNVIAIAAGNAHTVVLKSDSTVVAWGYDYVGQADVPSGLSNVVAIAAGSLNTVALKSNGRVVAWGDNTYGETTGTPSGTLTPVTANPVSLNGFVLSNVTAIAASSGFTTMALKSNGTVVVWGDGSYGQTNIPAGLTNVTAIAEGVRHEAALKSDGTVVAWGAGTNYSGTSLNYGQSVVPAGLTNVTAIAADGNDTVALVGTALPLPPPLTIILSGTNVIFSWPTNATGFTLQSATNLVSPVWGTVSPAPVTINTNNAVTNTISGAQMFYRLSQ